jgi:predicted acylesterase/phospholipase RssA
MRYDMVFEGGGAKGMAFAGACDELVRRGHTHGRLLGTSAGAITATLLAAGYSPAEMCAALTETEDGRPVFASFMGAPPPFTKEEVANGAVRRLLQSIDLKLAPDVLERRLDDWVAEGLARDERGRHVVALVERGGWYSAHRFVEWLVRKLDSGEHEGTKRAFSAATLEQMFAATGVELSVVAADTTASRMIVLNHNTAPRCPVLWATRMSMSIPLVWDEVLWRKEWGEYLGRDMTGHAIVDGGLLSNFPIELFVSDEPEVERLMGPKRSDPVLGLLIDETLSVTSPKARGWLVDVNVRPGELATVQRLQRLVDTATRAHDKMVMEQHERLVVHLPANGYGTTEFDMTAARRDALVDAARRAMAAYLDTTPPASAAARAKGPRPPTKADRLALRILS